MNDREKKRTQIRQMWRDHPGASQREIARRCGCSPSTVAAAIAEAEADQRAALRLVNTEAGSRIKYRVLHAAVAARDDRTGDHYKGAIITADDLLGPVQTYLEANAIEPLLRLSTSDESRDEFTGTSE